MAHTNAEKNEYTAPPFDLQRLETKRLIIRSFTENDYQDLYEYLSDPTIYVYEPGNPVCIDEARALASQRAKGNDFWAVELKENAQLIGHLYFQHIDPKEQLMWELGYIFNPKYQRKGFGSEAARALVLYAFENYPIHRVMARCNPKNIASWKLLAKIGFRREGYFREYGFFRRDAKGNPLWHDAYEYAILEKDLKEK